MTDKHLSAMLRLAIRVQHDAKALREAVDRARAAATLPSAMPALDAAHDWARDAETSGTEVECIARRVSLHSA